MSEPHDPSPDSNLVPRPRAGYESPAAANPIAHHDKLRLVAACARSGAGVLFAGMALLYLPTQFWTPVMSGVGLIMVVNGALGVWSVGRDEPRLAPITRRLTWVFPACLGLVFLVAAAFGPGVLGPDWDAMRARQEPPTWKPPGL